MDDAWPLLLGGAARPLGCTVTFIDRPYATFLEALVAFHEGTAEPAFVLSDPEPMPASLDHLDPMESPWTVELLVECRYGTAYLNNGLGGGDPTSFAPVVARQLGARAVMAQHVPRYGPGHAATQLWIQGPDGEPPLMYERTLSAHATDGRWIWEESGAVQLWERPERYAARRTRDRLDRELLVEYLAAMGIFADEPDFFGAGQVIRAEVPSAKRVRRRTAEEFRLDVGWATHG